MEIIRKDATITNTDEVSPGSFEVILSSPTLDRDGDTLTADGWELPLPTHITFDVDHGMNVASTVGSGVPRIDDAGNLVVSGTYSSLPRAQEVRTLVNEGHIRTTSVAFLVNKSTKGGKERVTRELLNGAFVSIPSNREALVMSSKAGARNSSTDAAMIQSVHDAASNLGASCGPPVPAKPGPPPAKSVKAVGDPLAEVDDDPAALAQSLDAVLDQAIALLDGLDLTTLPPEVQQALALVLAADAAADELLAALGLPDPDEESAAPPAAVPAVAPAKAAATQAEAADAEALALKVRSLAALAAGFTLSD